jgi:hypothetical protein
LGSWQSEDQRNIWNAQLLDIRQKALKWYGPWSEEIERQQYANAVLRYWGGDDPAAYATTDRGKNVTAADVPPEVAERYYAILDGVSWRGHPDGGYQLPDLGGVGGPVLKGLDLAERKRLTEFGAIAPRHYRHLHPLGTVIEGEEDPSGTLDSQNLYWIAYDPANQDGPIQLTWGGADNLRVTLKSLSNDYSTENYIQTWETNNAVQVGIIAQRIAHTIGSAILAAFPVTSAWSAPVYAAGNALIDMQQSILDQDASWVDAFNSLNEAGLEFLNVANQEQISAEEVNAKVENDGQYNTGGQYSTVDGGVAGGEGDTAQNQDVRYWAEASIEATDAVQAGDWDSVQTIFEEFGFDLPDSFVSDLVNEVATITGDNPAPYETTAPQRAPGSLKTFKGPRTKGDRTGGSVPSVMDLRRSAGELAAATGTQTYGVGPSTPNTAVILAALGLIVGLAWVL